MIQTLYGKFTTGELSECDTEEPALRRVAESTERRDPLLQSLHGESLGIIRMSVLERRVIG